jgi:predicted transcriptional regulator
MGYSSEGAGLSAPEAGMVIRNVQLQDDLAGPLEGLAERLRRSKEWLINQAIREYLERQELEEARWQETAAALQSVEAGQGIPEGEVHAWLESWGRPDERRHSASPRSC